jgi:hypothetical protein
VNDEHQSDEQRKRFTEVDERAREPTGYTSERRKLLVSRTRGPAVATPKAGRVRREHDVHEAEDDAHAQDEELNVQCECSRAADGPPNVVCRSNFHFNCK